MVRCFQVAGLVFSLDLPDGHPAADLLHNYDPFEIESRPDSQRGEVIVGTGRPADPGTLPSAKSERGLWPQGVTGGGAPFIDRPRVARFPEAAAGSAVLFELKLSDQPPGAPGEALLKPQEKTGEPVVGFFRSGEGYQAAFAPGPGAPVCGVLEMSGDFREGRLFAEGSPSAQVFALNNALMLLFAFASAPYAALEMHASVVLHGRRGFLFLGKSGTGKSTHSSLWLDHIPGTELLNDDNPVLRIIDGQARVFGSPWSGKTPCYKAKDAPVGAIVRLRQAPYNRIERLGMVHAYGSVMASCSGFRPIRSLADAQHETLSAIAQQVPCYQLECLPDEAAARLCQETVDE